MMDKDRAYLSAVSSIERLLGKSKHQKSTAVKSCIAALYTADN